MKHSATFEHDKENYCEACGVDEEKFDAACERFNELVDEMDGMSMSQTVEQIINLCDTPEQAVLMGYIRGMSN